MCTFLQSWQSTLKPLHEVIAACCLTFALPILPSLLADAPPITFVVVQKRHHTRLFPLPQDQQNRDRSGNVLPGAGSPCACAYGVGMSS
jgi:hypothetical protein